MNSLRLELGQWFALAWRVWMAVAGLVTLAMVGRTLSPSEQGYYFTFESLLNLRTIAEMGLSQVIIQIASHESASLDWTTVRALAGDKSGQARLAKLLHVSLRWYIGIGLVLGTFLLVGGGLFFRNSRSTEVIWSGPWGAASVVIALHFLVMPVLAFLEGLSQVAEVMRIRLLDVVVSSIVLWAALQRGFGLWAIPAFYLSSFLFQATWVVVCRRQLLRQIWRCHDGTHSDFWQREVLPFQWRMGVSWLSGYAALVLVNPIVFKLSGPVDAGRIGMSLLAAQGVLSVSVSIMRAKAPSLGRLIAARDWPRLKEVWSRGLLQTLVIATLGSLALPIVGFAVIHYLPDFSKRLMSVEWLTVLAVATIVNAATQAMAVYLRAYREEPLMWASIGVAAISLPLNLLAIRILGSPGACLAFLLIAVVNCIWTSRVIVRRTAYHQANPNVRIEGALV